MAGFTERLKIVVDIVSDRATGSLDKLKASAGRLAMAGGAALVAFGVKAVAVFGETAKAADDLSKATGLGVEEASRWIAVADDYQVSSEALSAAMVKAARKGLDFKDVLGQINAAPAGDRARVAFELLGKSASAIAPMLGKTRAEYDKMLSSVEKGQVITSKEAKKAEEMRLAQDKLVDSIKELALELGQKLVPVLEDMVPAIINIVEVADPLVDALGAVAGAVNEITSITDSGPFSGTLADDLDRYREGLEQLNEEQHATREGVNALTEAQRDAKRESYETTQRIHDQADAWDRVATKIALARTNYETWLDVISDDKAVIDLEIAMRDLAARFDEMGTLEQQSALLGMRQQLAGVLDDLEGVREGAIIKLVGEYTGFNIDEVLAKVKELERYGEWTVSTTLSNPIGGANGIGGNIRQVIQADVRRNGPIPGLS